MIVPLTVSFRKHFKVSSVYCLQAYYDIQLKGVNRAD